MKKFCVFSFFFSFFGCPQHMEFPGQGSALSCSCDLYHSCGNARSFNQLCQAGDQTYMSWHCREAADPVVPQWQLHNEEFWVLMLGGKEKDSYAAQSIRNHYHLYKWKILTRGILIYSFFSFQHSWFYLSYHSLCNFWSVQILPISLLDTICWQ